MSVKPTVEEIQEALIIAGRNMTGAAKGVGQWTGGKTVQVLWVLINNKKIGWLTYTQNYFF